MKECLLPIGSIVSVEITDELIDNYLIIGKRIVNPKSMKAWDYISVKSSTGLERIYTKDNKYDYDNFFYFNHTDIEKVIYKSKLNTQI